MTDYLAAADIAAFFAAAVIVGLTVGVGLAVIRLFTSHRFFG